MLIDYFFFSMFISNHYSDYFNYYGDYFNFIIFL